MLNYDEKAYIINEQITISISFISIALNFGNSELILPGNG